MSEKFNWSEYRPSKAVWFWSCIGCIVATLILGFTWGGWVTGGTAEEMAASARDDGRAQLVATLCVDRFVNEPDAAVQLAALREKSRWQRDDFVEEGGWAKLAGIEEGVDGAASLCAERLAEMELPPADATAEAPADTAVN
jgi:hypothetical protein